MVDANLFQGNQAGAGAGGAANIAWTVAGDDIVLTNNMMTNNVAAYAGGGVALSNTVAGVRLVNNTIASNVSTSSNRQAFGAQGPKAPSLQQVAGLAVLSGASPVLLNNILWANRSYIYLISDTRSGLYNPGTTLTPGPTPGDPAVITPNLNPTYQDIGRIAGAGTFEPRYSVLTTEGIGNSAYISGPSCTNTTPTTNANTMRCNRLEPAASTTLFLYPNSFDSIIDPTQPVVFQDQTVNLSSALTFDETGNFVNVIFSPLTLWDYDGPDPSKLRADYHIVNASSAKDNGRARNTSNGVNATIGAGFVPTVDIDRRRAPVGRGYRR